MGFESVLTWSNLVYCLVGVTLGTLIGVLPGIGPLATMAMLLPLTYQIADPLSSLIMLAGIYYGSQYGGSTTAILVNLPGESSSVVTTIDGYKMALAGRAGVALTAAAVGSFIAGTLATLVIATMAPSLVSVAFSFGPTEFTVLIALGLACAVVLGHGSLYKNSTMVILGLLFSMIGMDVTSGTERFTFGIPELTDGLHFGVMAMGLFGLGEIIYNLKHVDGHRLVDKPVRQFFPNRQDTRRFLPACLRGTVLGSMLGILPGAGSILPAFASYALEKKLSKNPKEFGKGAIEGVAGPESANNAGAQTSFIPMLSLGLPTTPVMAMMIAAMMINGVQPGPQVMTTDPGLFWGLIVSMWIGNVFLLMLNLPLIGIWIQILRVPYRWLYPMIIVFCCIGAYSFNNNSWDILMTIPFAIMGYFFKRHGFEPAPFMMAFILGDLLEEHLRRALILSHGDWMTFFYRPISLSMIVIFVGGLLLWKASRNRPVDQ